MISLRLTKNKTEYNVRERISTSFFLANFEEWTIGFYLRVQERPTELIIEYPDQNFVSIEQEIIYLELTMGDSIVVSLFYNDTSLIGGLLGGIINANFSEFTEMRAPGYLGSGSIPIVFQDGVGYYNFTFDTNNPTLYALHSGPVILEGEYFRFLIEIFDENRQLQIQEIRISIRHTPTSIVHDGQVVDPDENIQYTLINGDNIVFDFYLNDTWHGWGVDGASFDITSGATANISSYSSLGDGYYRVIILAAGYGGDSVIDITLSRDFYDDVRMSFTIRTEMNDFDRLVLNLTAY